MLLSAPHVTDDAGTKHCFSLTSAVIIVLPCLQRKLPGNFDALAAFPSRKR